MPRGLTADQKAQLAARVRAPIYFVALALVSTTARVWNGKGDTVVLGETWKGVGEHGVIQGIESDRTLKAQSISLALAGIPSTYITNGIIAATRAERYQGRPLTVYMGFANVQTGIPLHDPTPIWDGFADVLTFQLGRTISAVLTGEHFSSHLRRSNGLRMTTESHNRRLGNPSPRDLFFEPQGRLMGKPRPLL